MKGIIILPGIARSTSPDKVGDFVWNEKHQAYIYQGRELSMDEFNQANRRVVNDNYDRWPSPVYSQMVATVPVNNSPIKDDGRLARAREAKAAKARQSQSLQPA